MKGRRLIDSFNYAISGISYTLRTQRNMRIHFSAAIIILLAALFIDFSKIEMLFLIFSVSFVIITEMINTAIEKTIDLYTDKYHPLAEIAKNVAAGAVLISAFNAIIVAYFLFFDKVSPHTKKIIIRIKESPAHYTFISIILVMILVVIIKTKTNIGTPFRGGVVSGHSALAFTTATAITFIAEEALVATLSFFIAFLVGQSRVEGKIHSSLQVFIGAILGILITIFVFQIVG